MSIYTIIIIVLAILLIVLLIVSLFLSKVKYLVGFKEDEVLDTNNENYVLFNVESRYKKYIDNYKITKIKNDRFLSIKVNSDTYFFNCNILCYKDDKIYKIINVSDYLKKYNEEYLIKLPYSASSFKLEFKELNEEKFEDVVDIKIKKIRYYLLATIFALISVIPLTISYLIVYTIPGSSEYYPTNWENEILKAFFDLNTYIIVALIIFVLIFGLTLLFLFLLNKRKSFALLKNEAKEKEDEKGIDIKDYLIFKIKSKSRKERDENTKGLVKKDYFVVSLLKKRSFLSGTINIEVLNELDEVIASMPYQIDKYFKKVEILKTTNIHKLQVTYRKLYFKNFVYIDDNAQFHEYKNRNGVKGGIVKLKGFVPSFASLVLVALISASNIFININKVNEIKLMPHSFEYVDVYPDVEGSPLAVESYEGESKIVTIPATYRGQDVVEISPSSFLQNENLKEVYFSSSIKIGRAAFKDCTNLAYADLDDVYYIDYEAFKNTDLKEIHINENVEYISIDAFSEIDNIKSLTFNSSSLKLSIKAFANSNVNGDIHMYKIPKSIESASLASLTYRNCYIYEENYTLNKNNYKYYSLNRGTTFFLSDCVHDNASFRLVDGRIDNVFDSELVEETEGTCSKRGTLVYNCHKCGETFTVKTTFNESKHNYVDGECIWCGQKEPKE